MPAIFDVLKLLQSSGEETRRLSKEQRHIIQETFQYLYNDPEKNGQKIFVLLFSDFPDYKQIWPQFRAIPDSLIITADALKKHGTVYLNGLKSIINNLENEEKLVQTISRITIAHLRWRIRKTHIMNMLQEVLIILRSYPRCQEKTVEDAWFTLFDVIGNLVNKFAKKESQDI